MEGLQALGEALEGKLRLISVTVRATCPLHQPPGTQLCTWFWNPWQTACVTHGGHSGPCLLNVMGLCSDHWLLLLVTGVQTKRETATVVAPAPLQKISRGIMGPVSFYLPFVFLFCPFLEPGIKKQLHLWVKLENFLRIPGKSTEEQKSPEKSLFILQANAWPRQSITAKIKTVTKKASNFGKGRKSDFRNCHIIGFKCPVFNKNITGHSMKPESITRSTPIQRDRNCHWKRPDSRSLDQENNVWTTWN